MTRADEVLICPECGEECDGLVGNEAGEMCEYCDEGYMDAQASREADGEDLIDGVGFADPGGRSALRAATDSNPRNLPCPNCRQPNRLTPIDRARGYQCDACADRAERGCD